MWMVLQVMQPVTIQIAHGYHIAECTLEAAWWAMLFKLFWSTPSITALMDSRRPIDIIGVPNGAGGVPVALATPVVPNSVDKGVAAVDNDNTTAVAAVEVELEGYDTTRGEGQVAYATPVAIAAAATSSPYAVLVAPGGGYVPLQT